MSNPESFDYNLSNYLQKHSDSKSKENDDEMSTPKKIDMLVKSDYQNNFLYFLLFITFSAKISRSFILVNASQKNIFQNGQKFDKQIAEFCKFWTQYTNFCVNFPSQKRLSGTISFTRDKYMYIYMPIQWIKIKKEDRNSFVVRYSYFNTRTRQSNFFQYEMKELISYFYVDDKCLFKLDWSTDNNFHRKVFISYLIFFHFSLRYMNAILNL